MQNLGFCKFTVYICQKIVFSNFYIQLFYFLQQKKHPFIDAFFGILFFWIHERERRLWLTKRTLRQEHLSILLIGRGNMLWISFENLEYWRVNYHPPKGRWLLGSHRLLFKKFGIWVSTWILRQPLFLQACPHRLYCIGS